MYFVFALLFVVFQVLIYRLFLFSFAFFSCCLFVSILIENIEKYIEVARRYFAVDKKKRLLDKLGNLIQFYVEIVILIQNQVC